MATTKTSAIQAYDAGNLTPVQSTSAKIRNFSTSVSVSSGDFDADGDVVLLAQLPPNVQVISLKTFNDSLDSGSDTAPNIGIYNGPYPFTDSSGTSYGPDELISEQAYASSISSLQSADTTGTEQAFNNRDVANVNNQVWEDAGLPEDPDVPLRIGATQTTSVSGAQDGDLTLIVQYALY